MRLGNRRSQCSFSVTLRPFPKGKRLLVFEKSEFRERERERERERIGNE